MRTPEQHYDLVILSSGGYDSALLLHMALKMDHNPIALGIEYGQKHIRELESADKMCHALSIPFRRMSVDLVGINSGLTGSLEGNKYQGVHEMHVPGRNTIFLGLAVSLAESVGADRVWLGANMEDRLNEFPDCSQEYIHCMNRAAQHMASYPISIECPLLGMRKSTILRLGACFGINESDTHSGYEV